MGPACAQLSQEKDHIWLGGSECAQRRWPGETLDMTTEQIRDTQTHSDNGGGGGNDDDDCDKPGNRYFFTT